MPDRLEGQGEGGLTVFRAEHLNDRLGIIDPHARLFVTEGTRRYARIANAVDAALMGRSLARFQRFGERMASAAGRMEQLLILGVGFDTRALWLPEIIESGVRVFEVDLPATIERKVRVLAENGLSIRSAHIAGFGERAVDSFYVTDSKGRKPGAGPKLERLRLGLEAVLDRMDRAGTRHSTPVRASLRDVSEVGRRASAPDPVSRAPEAG